MLVLQYIKMNQLKNKTLFALYHRCHTECNHWHRHQYVCGHFGPYCHLLHTGGRSVLSGLHWCCPALLHLFRTGKVMTETQFKPLMQWRHIPLNSYLHVLSCSVNRVSVCSQVLTATTNQALLDKNKINKTKEIASPFKSNQWLLNRCINI